MAVFKNLSRHPDIGTNCYSLRLGETEIVLDAGTHPKHAGNDTLPRFSDIEEGALDAIFVSHPHLDHIGALPCLSYLQPEATVLMTEGTKQAGRALLHNSVNVMKALRTELDEPSYPLYGHGRVDSQYKKWMTQPIGKPFHIGDIDRVECQLYHAGHVMGAAGITFRYEGRTVFYTGDVHFEDQTITKAADFPTEGIDDLIIESTRGANERDPAYTRELEKQKMGEIITETIAGGGAVLIPVFAFGKTQEVVLMLKELMDEGLVPDSLVHIGGLSSKMTAISDDHADSPYRRHRGYKIMERFPDLEVMQRGRTEPSYEPGHIYALSSGMMSENTVSNRFAKHILTNPKDSLIFVGYADGETPGGLIQAVGRGGSVCLEKEGREYGVSCRVEALDFSGHATRDQLADYAVGLAPQRVILVHGDEPAKVWLKEEISRRLPETQVIIPEPGEEIVLD